MGSCCEEKPHSQTRVTNQGYSGAKTYTCPMHPEIQQIGQ